MQKFEPRDPAFEERVRSSYARQAVMKTLGASLGEVSPGRVEIRLPFREDLTQQHGFLHAGIVATVLDSACGYAAFTLMPAEAAVLSIEYKINLMAPARGELIVARGRVVRPGKTVTVCSGSAVAIDEGRETPVAEMQATMMTLIGREGLHQ